MRRALPHAHLVRLLAAEGLEASTWGNAPGDRYAAHRHAYDKVLVTAEGSISFGLPERGAAVDLAAGDRLELPAGTLHDALVGPEGVTCLEAHLPAGRLAHGLLSVPGWGAAAPASADGGPATGEV